MMFTGEWGGDFQVLTWDFALIVAFLIVSTVVAIGLLLDGVLNLLERRGNKRRGALFTFVGIMVPAIYAGIFLYTIN